jgi:Protein of unknown function (DUF3309)
MEQNALLRVKARRRGCLSMRAREASMLSTILVVILILFLIGALPRWGHSANWGYGPSGGLGLVLVILLILILMGKI